MQWKGSEGSIHYFQNDVQREIRQKDTNWYLKISTAPHTITEVRRLQSNPLANGAQLEDFRGEKAPLSGEGSRVEKSFSRKILVRFYQDFSDLPNFRVQIVHRRRD